MTLLDLPEHYNAARLLWDNLPDRADRPAIHHDSGTLTYGDVARMAARIGNVLRRHAQPGARVLMVMDDEPAYPAAIMGALRAGLVPMMINTLSTPDLIAFYLDDSSAEVVIVSDEFAPLFAGCAVPVLTAADWADADDRLDEHPTHRDDMAFWMYSSGSTGRPKGIVHTHAHPAQTAATYAAHILRMTEDDICFSVPKIFFAYGFGNSVTFPFHFGGSAVLLSGRPTPDRVFAAIERHRPTLFFGLPTLYTGLAHHAAGAGADLSSVRLCLSAAEILSDEIATTWRDRFGHRIVEGLGSTEMLHIYLSNTADRQVTGSAGQVVPGYEVRLVGPDGGIAPPRDEGVMWVRGPSAAEYYWNRPDKTAETMQEGWINTGDRFLCDSDGFHFFRGRADDLVKVSGQWVYPMEVELALNEHPAVLESCVLAVPLGDGRLTLAAWVSVKQGFSADDALTQALQSHAKSHLLPHKYPREITYLADLPKTGTDKIDRQALRKQWPEGGN